MTRARLSLEPGREFDVVHFKPMTAEWSLRDGAGEIVVFESDLVPDSLEVKCDFCERWSVDAAPARDRDGLWMCFGGIGDCPEDREA